jgi:hypothetical protein
LYTPFFGNYLNARSKRRRAQFLRWAACPDRAAATAPARRAFLEKFIDGKARCAYFAALSLSAVEARRKRRSINDKNR